MVPLDRESADRLGLPNEPDKWPRSLHGRLVRSLAKRGAAVQIYAWSAHEDFMRLLRSVAPDSAAQLGELDTLAHDDGAIERLARDLHQL